MGRTSTFSDIVSLWNSPKDLAEDLGGVSVITVRSWRHRGITGEYWHELAKAAKRRGIRGVSVERLAKMGSRATKAAA